MVDKQGHIPIHVTSRTSFVPLLSLQVGEWRHGLFNCFDDIGICIIAYFVPCVTFGQNAEAIGEGSCFLCGIYFSPSYLV